MIARSFRPVSLVALPLMMLAGCPGTDPVDGGLDTGSVDGGGPTDTPRTDAGVDAGTDAGLETECAGEDCTFVELELGADSTCARRENGTVVCWGYAQDGELGDGRMRHFPGCIVPPGEPARDCSARPVLVDLDVPALELEGAAHAYCAVTGTDREHLCWGERGFTIRTSAPTDRFSPLPETEFDGVFLEDAQSHACWIDGAGGVFCIGANGRGQLGNGSRMESVLPVVATLEADGSPITGALEIEAGTYGGNSCVRTATEILCWGTNDAGQLGDDTPDHADPEDDCGSAVTASDCVLRAVPVLIDGAEVVDLGIGFDHACALMTDGTVRCWGGNSLGQLGLGTNTPSFVPTTVPGVTDVAQLSVNGYNTCVRLTDGRVQCWGQSNVGQVGDGAEVHDSTSCSSDGRAVDCQLSPVFVMGLEDATELATGFSHSCAVRETNDIVCWGNNSRFQLGDDDRDPGYSPRTVAGL